MSCTCCAGDSARCAELMCIRNVVRSVLRMLVRPPSVSGASMFSTSTMCMPMYLSKLRTSCSCCAGASDRCAALRCVRNVCSAVLTAQVSLGGGGEDAVGVGVGSVVVGVGVGVGVLVLPVTVTAAVMSGCTAQ